MIRTNNINYAGSFFLLMSLGELTNQVDSCLKSGELKPEEVDEKKFKEGEFSLVEGCFVINRVIMIFFGKDIQLDFKKADNCEGIKEYMQFRNSMIHLYPINQILLQ
jgi:hypothetical protein